MSATTITCFARINTTFKSMIFQIIFNNLGWGWVGWLQCYTYNCAFRYLMAKWRCHFPDRSNLLLSQFYLVWRCPFSKLCQLDHTALAIFSQQLYVINPQVTMCHPSWRHCGMPITELPLSSSMWSMIGVVRCPSEPLSISLRQWKIRSILFLSSLLPDQPDSVSPTVWSFRCRLWSLDWTYCIAAWGHPW